VLQAQNLQGVGHHQPLHKVIGGRHTLKALEALESSGTTLGLVRYHAAAAGPTTAASNSTEQCKHQHRLQWAPATVSADCTPKRGQVIQNNNHQADV
jgi:phage protein U